MKTVVCINDRKLPEGAEVVNGREYQILEEFVNNFEQRVFIIKGIKNEKLIFIFIINSNLCVCTGSKI